MFKFKGGVQQF